MMRPRETCLGIDIDYQSQIRNQTMTGNPIDVQHSLNPQAPAFALISKSGIGEAVRENDLAFLERRQDPLLDILRARREHQQQFSSGAELLICGIQKNAADLPPDRPAARFG